ncbi:hypothetical protein SEVIR_2G252651v4 [Setaria viridis]
MRPHGRSPTDIPAVTHFLFHFPFDFVVRLFSSSCYKNILTWGRSVATSQPVTHDSIRSAIRAQVKSEASYTLSIFTIPLTSGSLTLVFPHGFIAPALADRRLMYGQAPCGPVRVQVSHPGRPHPHGHDLTRASSSPPVAVAAPTATRARHRSPPRARTQVSARSQEP